MAYFHRYSDRLAVPMYASARGLRRAQIGALHAIAAHFSVRREPAILSLPTGTGKTAVLTASAFLLRAQRVLLITPSRMVRHQIAEEFRSLGTLRDAGALHPIDEAPAVKEVEKRLDTADAWEDLRNYDVVVATPSSASPLISQVVRPDSNLFDVVFVDEAHHSRAATWEELVRAFPDAKVVQVTATPYRADRKEIQGRLIYTFPMSEAVIDGLYSDIEFISVDPGLDNHDIAIAKTAERVFQEDRAAGFAHTIMVRTDKKDRATELQAIYRDHTALRFEKITSNDSAKTVEETIVKLRHGALDGVLCVDMLGEGFDFPNLKIAAIHAPHRSLAATLQFIGRFVRTNAPNLGAAKFIAIPAEIEIEAEKLYREGAVWEKLVKNLNDTRLAMEERVRTVLSGFQRQVPQAYEAEDLSLYSVRPFFLVKVFHVDGVDLNTPIDFGALRQVVDRQYHPGEEAALIITRVDLRPRWATVDILRDITFDLFVVHYDADASLLFVCASCRKAALYESLARQVSRTPPIPLPMAKINKVLIGLENARFFSVGMRSRVPSAYNASYTILSSKAAENTVRPSDARSKSRGHLFGKALENGRSVTIGFSSGSKIWSIRVDQLPHFLDWCNAIARKLSSDAVPVTGSNIDLLPVGESITTLPTDVIAVDWDHAYSLGDLSLEYVDNDGVINEIALVDLDLSIDQERSADGNGIAIHLSAGAFEAGIRYTFGRETIFVLEYMHAQEARVRRADIPEAIPLLDYINATWLQLYQADFSLIHGNQVYRSANHVVHDFESNRIEVVDWATNNVDITSEFGAEPGRLSVHDYIEHRLQTEADIVVYDHGSGEIADFIAFTAAQGRIRVSLYHCKASDEAFPGRRLSDIYEVTGQVVKSVAWAGGLQDLVNHLIGRTQRCDTSRFVKGTDADLSDFAQRQHRLRSEYSIVLVQPGVSASRLTEDMSSVLAAADDYVIAGNCLPLEFLGSA